jgi:hypothetical protein
MKIALAPAAALVLLACGGSSPPAEAPKSHVESKSKAEPKSESEPAQQKRSGVECEDGSCFACGEAVCLSGFFCSVGRSGRGCAWVPSCPGKATCACLGQALREEPSCSCQEKEGAVYVVCDGARL